MFRTRLLTAAICLPVMAILLAWGGEYFRGLPLFIGVAAVATIGVNEFYRQLWRKNVYPVWEIGYVGVVGVLAIVWFVPWRLQLPALILALFAAVAGSLITQFGIKGESSPIMNVSATLFGLVYCGVLFAFLLKLRQVDLGQAFQWLHEPGWWNFFRAHTGALVITIAAAWIADTAAFATGKTFGRRKLCPYLSPGKTVVGAVGGWFGAVIAGSLFAPLMSVPMVHGLVLGAIIGIVSQLGDLGKSVLKRDLGIKDFGTIIPGHGGVLDRFDGLLFAMPVAWVYFKIFVLG